MGLALRLMLGQHKAPLIKQLLASAAPSLRYACQKSHINSPVKLKETY